MNTTRFRGAKLSAVMALSGLSLAGSLAQAGNWQRDYDDRGRYDRQERYESRRDVEYARVLDVTPLVERVRYREPIEQCYDVARSERRTDRTGATLLGGVLGAVVGSRFGSGDGRRAATVAGAVVGGAIGHDAAGRDDSRGYDDRDRYEQRCSVHDEARYEERIRAYRVAYRYHGRDYVAELPYDPGPRLRVAVDARPL